ncbi:uncharacterized protein LOC126095424 [Schistocerca cancellata]|uniref:uncharacterized protein LOC126095424 n=1 Tax=Schistocerca cancellata TaxID=274614 RepID=UPI0021193C9C|nr:uncharacterized protein LOC126095424 [Schistocerca cancellata]
MRRGGQRLARLSQKRRGLTKEAVADAGARPWVPARLQTCSQPCGGLRSSGSPPEASGRRRLASYNNAATRPEKAPTRGRPPPTPPPQLLATREPRERGKAVWAGVVIFYRSPGRRNNGDQLRGGDWRELTQLEKRGVDYTGVAGGKRGVRPRRDATRACADLWRSGSATQPGGGGGGGGGGSSAGGGAGTMRRRD